jgi:hypothetical protein
MGTDSDISIIIDPSTFSGFTAEQINQYHKQNAQKVYLIVLNEDGSHGSTETVEVAKLASWICPKNPKSSAVPDDIFSVIMTIVILVMVIMIVAIIFSMLFGACKTIFWSFIAELSKLSSRSATNDRDQWVDVKVTGDPGIVKTIESAVNSHKIRFGVSESVQQTKRAVQAVQAVQA